MTVKPRFISGSEHQSAHQTVKEGKSEYALKRFLNDAMNGKQCDPKDALVVAYAITQALLNSEARKVLGLPSKGRGKGSKTDLSHYSISNSRITSIVLRFKGGFIKRTKAYEELRNMIGDVDADKSVDTKTLSKMLNEACDKYGGLYDFLGEDGVNKINTFFTERKHGK
jgi:hypothetical protein